MSGLIHTETATTVTPTALTEIVPPGSDRWWEFFPAPFDTDPNVVIVMVPTESTFQIRETPDGEWAFGVSMWREKILGVQIIKPQYQKPWEHEEIFKSRGVNMAQPAYIGPLSDVPQRLLMSTDFSPIAILRDEYCRPPLNIKETFTGLRKEGTNGN